MTAQIERLAGYASRRAATTQRRNSAVLYADVVGYTRLARRDEDWTLEALADARARFSAAVSSWAGRTVATPGDAVLAEFANPADAALCAVDAQQQFLRKPLLSPEGQCLQFRVGLHYADVVPDGVDILGDGVNIAARIAEIAEPGGICFSASIYDRLCDKLDLLVSDLGNVMLRGDERRSRLYRIDVAAENDNTGDAAVVRLGSMHLIPYLPSLAVLPFSNTAADASDDHIVDGLTDTLINTLASSRLFYVIARSSSFRFRGSALSSREIGHALGVRYLVQGSFQRVEREVRVTTFLAEAETGRLLHSHRFEGRFLDAFLMQDAIALQIAATIEPSLISKAAETSGTSALDADALDLVLKAYSKLWEMTPDGVAVAMRYLHAAIEAAPSMSRAHAGLANAATLEIYMDWAKDPLSSIKMAHEAASRAIALDRTDAWAHMALGVVSLQMSQAEAAIDHLKTAVRLNPSLAMAYGFMAHAMIFGGRLEEAQTLLRLALRLSPRDILLVYWLDGLAMVHLTANRFEDAVFWAQRAVRENPFWPGGWRALAIAQAHLDNLDAAAQALSQMLAVQPGFSMEYARRLWPFSDEARFASNIAALRKAGWEGVT